MRLLVCTQVVDRPDPTLGFFHRWLEELAKHFELITVICLKRGECHLPANVRILSLGKEEGRSRFKYLRRFYHHVWSERHDYDAVFVHMNQEYILLGGLLWKLLGKRIYLWRNHYAGSFLTDIAAALCRKVFCTSRYSYTAKYSQTVIMPVGFDTTSLANLPKLERRPRSILSLGRVSPSKNIHIIIEALAILQRSGVSFSANIYGNSTPEDDAYRERLIARASELGLSDKVKFYPAVPNTETPTLYATHEISVNASPSGMLDKTIFSAMGRGALVLASSGDLAGTIPAALWFKEGDAADLARALHGVLNLSAEEKNAHLKSLQNFVFQKHSLSGLANKLFEEMSH